MEVVGTEEEVEGTGEEVEGTGEGVEGKREVEVVVGPKPAPRHLSV